MVGGAIADYSNSGVLQIYGCTFDHNSAYAGGAIFAGGSGTISATLQDSTFTGNSAVGGSGGALYAARINDPLKILGCTFSQNTAYYSGGAVFASGGEGTFPVTIQNSTLSGNSARNGGGIEIRSTGLSVSNSTITGNTGARYGGGLDVEFATSLSITDSTIDDNTASYGGGLLIYDSPAGGVIQNCTIVNNHALYTASAAVSGYSTGGGGVLLYSGSLTIQNCTITNNTAAGSFGGGIWVKGPPEQDVPAELTLASSIVSGNSDTTGAEDIGRFTGSTLATINASNDLFSTNPTTGSSGVINGTYSANLVNTDPLLGPLADNGGPTLTMALAPNSPALDKGSNPAGLTFDQRGSPFVRTFGGGTDIGALESQPFTTSTTLTSSRNPADVGQSVTFTATVSDTLASTVVPTGTVTFFDGSTALATVTLTNGVATFTTSSLGVGTHPITAVYNGAVGFDTFSPSTSAVLNEVIESPPPPPSLFFYAVGTDSGIAAEVKVYNAATGASCTTCILSVASPAACAWPSATSTATACPTSSSAPVPAADRRSSSTTARRAR